MTVLLSPQNVMFFPSYTLDKKSIDSSAMIAEGGALLFRYPVARGFVSKSPEEQFSSRKQPSHR